jgi:hypothetical protein
VKKSRVTIIVLFAVLGTVLLLYFIYSNSSDKKHSWYENYKIESKEPYGMYFIRKLLEGYRPDSKFTINSKKALHQLLDSGMINSNTDYIFIGQSIYLDERDTKALMNFVKAGHDAFIASQQLPDSLMLKLDRFECAETFYYSGEELDAATMNFYHDTLAINKGYTFRYRLGSEDERYYWQSLASETLCDSMQAVVPLGYITNGYVNFFRIRHGDGYFYFHANPIVFTNYFMRVYDKVEYASGIFSHLRGRNIVWDEFSKIPFFYSQNNPYNSPLYFIMQQPSLKYAWWMLLACVILYVLFAAKRTQRVIPVLEQKTNSSLEFVNLVAALHYQNGNHLDIARKKMKYFLYFVKSRYGIHAHLFDTALQQRLADKSKVSLSEIKDIFDNFKLIDQYSYSNIESDKLTRLFYSIENFYKHCK